MDATQFQGLVVAWGVALTTLIGVLLGLVLTARRALAAIRTAHGMLSTQVAVNAVKIEHANGNGHAVLPPQNQAP